MEPDRVRAAAPLLGGLALGLAALTLGAAWWFGSWSPEPDPPLAPVAVDPAPRGAEPAPAPLTVHVSGWVERPGLVVVAAGSRVADAVAAAGGARIGARLDAINLAEPVADGIRVVVPGPFSAADSGVGEPGSGTAVSGSGKVAVNRAGSEDLQRLPGVGPVLAERILAHREANGPFRTVEDLLDVPGIGEGRLAQIRDLVEIP